MRGAVRYSLSSVSAFYSRDLIPHCGTVRSYDDLSQGSLRFGQPAVALT